MSIQFHDPRAEPSHRVEAYRLKAALDGPIAIGLLANGFPDSVEFLEELESGRRRIASGRILHPLRQGRPSIPVTAHLVEEIVERCDAVVTAYGH